MTALSRISARLFPSYYPEVRCAAYWIRQSDTAYPVLTANRLRYTGACGITGTDDRTDESQYRIAGLVRVKYSLITWWGAIKLN